MVEVSAHVVTICDCGHPPSPHDSFTTGYGRDDHNKTYCYECCAERDKEQMRKEGKFTGYLVVSKPPELQDKLGTLPPLDRPGAHRLPDGSWEECIISNWPGSLKFYPIRWKKGTHRCFGGGHGYGLFGLPQNRFRQGRVDAWFVFEGAVWHAVQRGDNNQICRCKRTKGKIK